MATWFWQKDLRYKNGKKGWYSYGAENSKAIEKAWKAEQQEHKLNDTWILSFKDMVQYRVDDTERQRPIQRQGEGETLDIEIIGESSGEKDDDEDSPKKKKPATKKKKVAVKKKKKVVEEDAATTKKKVKKDGDEKQIPEADKEASLDEKEFLIKTLEDKNKELKEEMEQKLQDAAKELKQVKETQLNEIKELKGTHEKEIKTLKTTQTKEVNNIKDTHNKEISGLKDTHNKEIKDLKGSHEKEVKNLKDAHLKETENVKADFAEQLSTAKKEKDTLEASYKKKIADAEKQIASYKKRIDESDSAHSLLQQKIAEVQSLSTNVKKSLKKGPSVLEPQGSIIAPSSSNLLSIPLPSEKKFHNNNITSVITEEKDEDLFEENKDDEKATQDFSNKNIRASIKPKIKQEEEEEAPSSPIKSLKKTDSHPHSPVVKKETPGRGDTHIELSMPDTLPDGGHSPPMSSGKRKRDEEEDGNDNKHLSTKSLKTSVGSKIPLSPTQQYDDPPQPAKNVIESTMEWRSQESLLGDDREDDGGGEQLTIPISSQPAFAGQPKPFAGVLEKTLINASPGKPNEVPMCVHALSNSEIAVGFVGGEIQLWNIDTGKKDAVLKPKQPTNVFCICALYKKDEKTPVRRMATGSGRFISIWDITAKKLLKQIDVKTNEKEESEVSYLLFLKNGVLAAAVSGGDPCVRIYNLNSYECDLTLKVRSNEVRSIVELKDQRLVVAGCSVVINNQNLEEGAIEVWTISGKKKSELKSERTLLTSDEKVSPQEGIRVNALALSPDGSLVAAYEYCQHGERMLLSYKFETKEKKLTDFKKVIEAKHRPDDSTFTDVGVLPNGKILCTTWTGNLMLFDPDAKEKKLKKIVAHEETQYEESSRIHILPNGRVITLGGSGCLKIWK